MTDASRTEDCQRLDKWLWFARFARTRVLAAELVVAGQVRLNRIRVVKPGHDVRPGDVLTLGLHGQVRVVRVLGLAPRRGPAGLARTLYEDLAASPVHGGPGENVDASGA